MGQLVEEVKIWNTPLVTAYLLWKFTEGYSRSHPNGDAPIGILHFIAGGLLTSEKCMNQISDKRTDLQSFVRGFEDSKDSDLLLGIQERIRLKMPHTLEAIDVAVAEGLLIWDVKSGKIYSRPVDKIPNRGNTLKDFYKRNGNKAGILGKWFSQHDLNGITSYLKIVL